MTTKHRKPNSRKCRSKRARSVRNQKKRGGGGSSENTETSNQSSWFGSLPSQFTSWFNSKPAPVPESQPASVPESPPAPTQPSASGGYSNRRRRRR